MKTIVHKIVSAFSDVSWVCQVFLFTLILAADCSTLVVRHKQMLDQRTM